MQPRDCDFFLIRTYGIKRNEENCASYDRRSDQMTL